MSKVGNEFLVDGSGDELSCGSAAITIAIDRSGQCCGLRLSQGGELSAEDFTKGINVPKNIISFLETFFLSFFFFLIVQIFVGVCTAGYACSSFYLPSAGRLLRQYEGRIVLICRGASKSVRAASLIRSTSIS